MRVGAETDHVPLFDRLAIRRHWNDSGDFGLFSASHGLELAKRVHDCLGRALSKFVIDAARLNPAQPNLGSSANELSPPFLPTCSAGCDRRRGACAADAGIDPARARPNSPGRPDSPTGYVI